MIYRIVHTKIKVEQHEPQLTPRVNSSAPEGSSMTAPLVTSVVLLLIHTNII